MIRDRQRGGPLRKVFLDSFKMFPCMLFLLIAIVYLQVKKVAKPDKSTPWTNSTSTTVWLETPSSNFVLETFGSGHIYCWYFMAVTIKSFFIVLPCGKSSILGMSLIYAAYEFMRLFIRYGTDSYDELKYQLNAVRMIYSTMVLSLWYIKLGHCALISQTKGLKLPIIVCRAIAQARYLFNNTYPSISFDVAFFCMTHDRSSWQIDSLHLLVVCLNAVALSQLKVLDNRQTVNRNLDSDDRRGRIGNGRGKLALYIILFNYPYLVSAYVSPNNPLHNSFIYEYSESVKYSMALIACFYGAGCLTGVLFAGFLREKQVHNFWIELTAFVSHFTVFTLTYFKFGAVTFEVLVANAKISGFTVSCAFVLSFGLSIICVQTINFYVVNFPKCDGYVERLTWNLSTFIAAGMFFMKTSSGGLFQLLTLCLSALFCLVGFWCLEFDILKRNNKVYPLIEQAPRIAWT